MIRIKTTIEDRAGASYSLTAESVEGTTFIGLLERHGQCIGRLNWNAVGDEWILHDLRINDRVPVKLLLWLHHLCISAPTVNCRRRGLGSALLRCFVGLAQERGGQQVRGSVVQRDLDETPDLLSWYKKHGFQVLPPTTEELRDSVARVQLDLAPPPQDKKPTQ